MTIQALGRCVVLGRWLSTAPETRDDLLKLVQDSRQFFRARYG